MQQYDKRAGGTADTKRMYQVLAGVPVFLILGSICWIFWKIGTINSPQFQESKKEAFFERGVANQFNRIQISVRVMPSQNTEGNMILMEWTDKANSEDDDLGQKVDVGDHYFLWRDTKDYFQTIKVDEAYVPLGDSKPMCIHIQWVKREMRKMVDKYRSVSAMGDCDNALNPKFRWQQSDPRTGVDVKPYVQTSYYTDKETCKSGEVFVKAAEHEGGKCYSY